jgi:hypothetical protein
MCCSQTERIAHDLKNCMSVLLLAITSLKDNTDQPFISVSRRRVLENVVEEMNRLVDEDGRIGGKADEQIIWASWVDLLRAIGFFVNGRRTIRITNFRRV